MILCAYFNKRKRFVIAEKVAVKLPDTMLVNLFAENVTYTLKIAEKTQIHVSEVLILLMDA